jgi:two-component system, NtrC family, sensor histidine kinase AtoS
VADRAKLLELRNIHVSYGAVAALDGVDFDLYAGEIHGLVGEHRAGKSTLVKVLSGAARVTAGTISLGGARVDSLTPKRSLERGIGIVYQDLSVIPHLDAVENIFTGRMLRRGLRLDHAGMQARVEEILRSLECAINPRAPIAKLSQGHQHMVELARAIALEPRILILDELSNKLTPVEMKVVYRAILDLRERGCGVVYISHDMDEILRLADTVTVLRGGHRRLTAQVKGLDKLRLYELTYSFSLDETRRAAARAPLQRLVRDLQSVVQAFPVGVVLLDGARAMQMYNLAAHELCSLDGAGLDRPFFDLLRSITERAEDAERAELAFNAAEPFRADAIKLGNGKTVTIYGTPIHGGDDGENGVLLVLEDVSLNAYLNDYAAQNAKLSTVAQLAVGVAHEMNNPLFAIQNYLEVIRSLNADPEIDNRLTRIEREISRITEIVSRLLSFSRVRSRPLSVIDLRTVVENSVILLQHAFREKSVAVDLDLPPDPIELPGDENRLTQVVLNLAANAVDAVLNGGRIGIHARRAPDGWAEISITDNGCGIPEDQRERIFDPFFTTKLSRRNTGLGLSICRNIVQEHRGAISFESRPGSGTSFLVRLPCAQAVPSAPAGK